MNETSGMDLDNLDCLEIEKKINLYEKIIQELKK